MQVKPPRRETTQRSVTTGIASDRPWEPEAYASFWINHASRLLMREFEARLRPFGLGMAYLPVVFALAEHGALLQKDLAAHAHVEQPTMAALLTRMERDGLIAREPHPDDRRATTIRLTPKAKRAIPEARGLLGEVADRVTEGFSETERTMFVALLQRAVANLSA